MIKSIGPIGLLLILYCFPLKLLASDEPIGKVIKLRGKVYKIKEDEEGRKRVAADTQIFKGDQINTTLSSFIKIQTIDGTTYKCWAKLVI